MRIKLLIPAITVLILSYGCVKETYDVDKISKKAHISPTFFVPVFKGTATFSDMAKENDTVIFDDDKFVRIVFKKDDVVDLSLDDFYNLDDLVNFRKTYPLGELRIDPFEGSFDLSLGEIIQGLPAFVRDPISALDGTQQIFPGFPQVSVAAQPFTQFQNIQQAVLSNGHIDLTIVNNLPVPLSGFQIQLSNSNGPIGSAIVFGQAAPGQTITESIDIQPGTTLSNTMTASVTITGCPQGTAPVNIDLSNSGLSLIVKGRDLAISSGTVILPQQTLTDGGSDVVDFTMQQGMELQKMEILSGSIAWGMETSVQISAAANITLTDILRSGAPLSETLRISSSTHNEGTILLDNTTINLDGDPAQPYNRIPFNYNFTVSSNNSFVVISSTDVITLDFSLYNPSFNYVKGYFGQATENIENETIDLDIEEALSKITGDFFIADPSITLNYKNSFAIPLEILMDIEGTRGQQTINLGVSEIAIQYPSAPQARDIEGSYVLSKTNSNLPELVSLPPEIINFSGSASMNPDGDPNHLRNNYLFGDSRFVGSLEVEVPLELRFNNLHLRDTTDNFLSDEDFGFEPEDVQMLALDLKAKNGFPFGISFSIGLYDSLSQTIISKIDVTDFLQAAAVDANGKVTTPSESNKRITFTDDFLNKIDNADQIIFDFGINTTGTNNVKIYSDYKIDFSVVLGINPDIDLDL
ncbi:MAG TPA: hypothetical protein VHO50_08135 [Bacteroidales bacterium]|nr:hypothetical protein [Bacteroidales bacterium]